MKTKINFTIWEIVKITIVLQQTGAHLQKDFQIDLSTIVSRVSQCENSLETLGHKKKQLKNQQQHEQQSVWAKISEVASIEGVKNIQKRWQNENRTGMCVRCDVYHII